MALTAHSSYLATVSSTGSMSTACLVASSASRYVYVLDSFSNNWRNTSAFFSVRGDNLTMG